MGVLGSGFCMPRKPSGLSREALLAKLLSVAWYTTGEPSEAVLYSSCS